jgi:hypothetical protein
MKAVAFTLALLLGGAAIAQTTTDTTPDTTGTASTGATTPDTMGTMQSDTSTTTSTTDTSSTQSGTSMTTDTNSAWSNSASNSMTLASNMPPATGSTVAPDNSNPERDARGIAVISAPAIVPAGWNGTAGTNTGMGGPELDTSGNAVADTGSAPPCSRTVTDHCLQTYERGRKR